MDPDALMEWLSQNDCPAWTWIHGRCKHWPFFPLIEAEHVVVSSLGSSRHTRRRRTTVIPADVDGRDLVAHWALISTDCSCGSPLTRWKTTGNFAADFSAAWSAGLFTAISTGPDVEPLATISPTSHALP